MVSTLNIKFYPRPESVLMGNGQQSNIRPVKAACYLVGGHADLFDQPHLVGVHWGQPIEQVDLLTVGGGVAEHAQRVKGGKLAHIRYLCGIVYEIAARRIVYSAAKCS